MKTVSENANRNVSDKVSKKGTRKFLQTLQPSGGDKENLVGTGRFIDKNNDTKTSKIQVKTEVDVKTKENKYLISKINPLLYKKLIIEDLTSTAGPSEKYWEVIAERRRKALEEVLQQNNKLHSVIMALEEENASCKQLLDQTKDLVKTLTEMINEQSDDDNDDEGQKEDNSHTEMKQLNNDIDCSNNQSE